MCAVCVMVQGSAHSSFYKKQLGISSHCYCYLCDLFSATKSIQSQRRSAFITFQDHKPTSLQLFRIGKQYTGKNRRIKVWCFGNRETAIGIYIYWVILRSNNILNRISAWYGKNLLVGWIAVRIILQLNRYKDFWTFYTLKQRNSIRFGVQTAAFFLWYQVTTRTRRTLGGKRHAYP